MRHRWPGAYPCLGGRRGTGRFRTHQPRLSIALLRGCAQAGGRQQHTLKRRNVRILAFGKMACLGGTGLMITRSAAGDVPGFSAAGQSGPRLPDLPMRAPAWCITSMGSSPGRAFLHRTIPARVGRVCPAGLAYRAWARSDGRCSARSTTTQEPRLGDRCSQNPSPACDLGHSLTLEARG